jgi:hypothetical protein
VASVADPARRGFRSRFPGRAANLATLSEAGGIYSLPVPELRPFVLTAVHADFAPGLGTLAFAGERRDIVLLPGSELIVRVVAGTASARAPDGAAPGAGAFVCASIALPDSAEMLWEGEGEADGGGAIAFRGVPAGDVSVSATWQRQRAACRVTTDGRGRAACTLELRATGGIQGVVRDRASQLPIEGARVGIPYDAETITDRSGRYHLDGISLGVGVSSLEARARGYVAHSEPVVVDKGSEQQTVNFELERGVRATGTVLDRSGRAIAGATVTWTRAIDASGLPAGEHTTDARGAFEVDGLRPEKVYRLLVLAERYATGIFSCGPFDARASGAVPADIGTLTLDAAGSIAGDVVEARAGKPYFVRLHWEEDRTASLAAGFSLVETARTDSRGRFAFQALPAGSYRLALSPTARANSWEIPLAEEIVAIAAGEHRKDVVLGASIEAITGTVTKESGEAFRRCRVRLYSLSSPARELAVVYSDSDGRFRLLVHAPGPFRVVADDPQLLFDSRAIEPVAVHQDLRFVLPEFRSEHVITGRVITIAGEVPKDVFVGFTDPVTKERLSRFAIPGPDGRFEMKNLRGVAYDVESVDFLGRHETARITGVWPGRADVELRLSPRR